jgi:hypothetical protein
MRLKPFFFAYAVFAVVGVLQAGTVELQAKESVPATITQSEPWLFTIAAPRLDAGLDGTIGIRGVDADVDIDFGDIFRRLDMIYFLSIC